MTPAELWWTYIWVALIVIELVFKMAIFHTRWWAKEQLARGGALAGEVLGNIITLCKGFIALKIKMWSNFMSIIWWLDWYIRQDKNIQNQHTSWHTSWKRIHLYEQDPCIFTQIYHNKINHPMDQNPYWAHGRWFPGIRLTQLTFFEPPTIGHLVFLWGWRMSSAQLTLVYLLLF